MSNKATAMSTPLSDVQYRQAGGCQCPVCGSDNIEANGSDVQGETCYQDVSCNECDASWNDVYKLVGYDDLKDEQGTIIPHDDDGFDAPVLLKERLESSVKMMVNALDNMAYLFSKDGPSALTPEAHEWRKMLQKEVRDARAVLAKLSPED